MKIYALAIVAVLPMTSQAALIEMSGISIPYYGGASAPAELSFEADFDANSTSGWSFSHDGAVVGTNGTTSISWVEGQVMTDKVFIGNGQIDFDSGATLFVEAVGAFRTDMQPLQATLENTAWFNLFYDLGGDRWTFYPKETTISEVSEPATYALLGLGLLGLGLKRRFS